MTENLDGVTELYLYGDSRCINKENCYIENHNLDFVCVGFEKCPNGHKKQSRIWANNLDKILSILKIRSHTEEEIIAIINVESQILFREMLNENKREFVLQCMEKFTKIENHYGQTLLEYVIDEFIKKKLVIE